MAEDDARRARLRKMDSKEYRDHFSRAAIRELLSAQIRTTREARGWSQAKLAEAIGSKQSAVSRLENLDDQGVSLATLERVAQALDVALVVRLAPFEELSDWMSDLTADQFAVKGWEAGG